MGDIHQKEINVGDLHFDLRNPRFMGQASDESKASSLLFADGGAKECYDSFKAKGFVPVGESLLVIENGDSGGRIQYTVLEGNCRLAAAKKLNSEVTDDKAIKSFQCLVYPDRDAAAPAVTLRHIEGNKKWPALQKKYYFAQPFLVDGKSVEEIADLTDMSEAEVKAEIQGYLAIKSVVDGYNKLRTGSEKEIDLSAKFEAADFIGGRVFKALSKEMGLGFAKDTMKLKSGRNVISEKLGLQDHYDAVCHAVVSHILDDTLNTRVFNKKSDWKKVKRQLPDVRSALNDYASFAKAGSGNTAIQPNIVSGFPAVSAKRGSATQKHCIINKKVLISKSTTLAYAKIGDVIDEMSRLSMEDFPYSSAFMFRQLLELSLQNYSTTSGTIKTEHGLTYTYHENSLESATKGAFQHIVDRKGLINDKDQKNLSKAIDGFATDFNTLIHDPVNGIAFESFFKRCRDLNLLIRLLLNS